MNKYPVFLITVLVLFSSCNRSQFSTTTRHTRNGKVTYVNHPHAERHKVHKRQSLPEPGITEDNYKPVSYSVNPLASISYNPVSLSTNKNSNDPDYLKLNHQADDDTIKNNPPENKLAFDPSFAHIIKFKNGDADTVRIISHSADGLYYHLISEAKKTRFVLMAQVDTILTDTTFSFTQEEEKPVVKVKLPERKGLIHSIIGFIPVAGIPFAIVGIILGARSLHRIRKNLAGIEGKKMAISTIIIGTVALIFNIIITIVIFSAILASVSASVSGCDSGIHF